MSSILKALKKLEEEKTIRRGESPNIARGFLKDDDRRRGLPHSVFFTTIVGVAAIAVVATYLFMRPVPERRVAVSVPVPAPPAAQPALPTPAAAAALGAAAPAADQDRGNGDRKSSSPAIFHDSAEDANEAPVHRNVSGGIADAYTTTAPPEAEAQPTSPAPSPVVSQLSQAPPLKERPLLVLTGIAYQKDSASRFAMINGTAAGVGSVVGGATVLDIFQDRVRLSFKGENFDLHLGRGSD